jgi:hypothetical protein
MRATEKQFRAKVEKKSQNAGAHRAQVAFLGRLSEFRSTMLPRLTRCCTQSIVIRDGARQRGR